MYKLILTGCAMLLGLAVVSQSAPPARTKTLRLMSEADDTDTRKMLPKTNDEWLNELFSKDLIFYTDKEMPRAYQHEAGVHSPSYNISAVPTEPHGNANVEFPWGHPAGTHRATNSLAVRFVHLPAPIRWWNEKLWRELYPQEAWGFKWEYPENTTFAEMLMLKDEDGKKWTYEVRTRTKTDGKWRMNAFRPFVTRAELVKWLETNAPEVKLGKAKTERLRLKSRHPRLTVIDRTAVVDELPEMPKKIVAKLLKEPFKSALGQEWIKVDDEEGFAPTTQSNFSIVPKNYDGAFLKVDSKACMTCHDGVMKNADDFENKRDWYGRVRGSDGIFSFHIFDPGSISDNGFSHWPKLRKSLVEKGLLKHSRDK